MNNKEQHPGAVPASLGHSRGSFGVFSRALGCFPHWGLCQVLGGASDGAGKAMSGIIWHCVIPLW